MTLLNSKYLFIENYGAFIRQVLTPLFPAERDLTETSRITPWRKKRTDLYNPVHLCFSNQLPPQRYSPLSRQKAYETEIRLLTFQKK